MGNWYVSVTLRGPSQNDVFAHLEKKKRKAIVSPQVDRYTVVFDEECESFDTATIESFTADTSKQFQCPALTIMNADDDLLWYRLYKNGVLIDGYSSSSAYADDPAREAHEGPLGGNASKLCEALDISQDRVGEVETVLRKPNDSYVFAVERHQDLVKSLGLPEFSVGAGFSYVGRGDIIGLDAGVVRISGN
jgi:hypothetical protein